MYCNLSYTVSSTTLEALRQVDIIAQSLIFIIGLPVVSVAFHAIARLVRVDHITPVYVINLLLSDLLQILIRPLLIKRVVEKTDCSLSARHFVFLLGLFGSTGFMLCITVERYVAVAHPLWYQRRHTMKCSILICLVIWVLVLTITLLNELLMSPQEMNFRVYFMNAVLALLLFMFLVVCYFGTWRAVRSVRSLPDREKTRIMHLLGMVVGTYGVLFMPLCIISIYIYSLKDMLFIPMYFGSLFVQLNPMMDPFLYIFIRKDVNMETHCCVTL